VKHISRKALVIAGALAVSIGAVGVAQAAPNTAVVAQVTVSGNPSIQSSDTAAKMSLFTEISNLDEDNSPAIPADATTSTDIDYDKDITWTANKYLPKCDPQDVDLETADVAAANCPKALIGSGTAYARAPGFPTANNELQDTVLAFNGPESTTDMDPGFDGGNPTVLLNASNASGLAPTTLVTGEIRPSTAGPSYGIQLHVPTVPLLGSGTGALVRFEADVEKSYTNGKTGAKKKTYSVIKAKCTTDSDDHTVPTGQFQDDDTDWDALSNQTYEDSSTDTDHSTFDCTPKA